MNRSYGLGEGVITHSSRPPVRRDPAAKMIDFEGPPRAQIFRADDVGTSELRRKLADYLIQKENELREHHEPTDGSLKQGLVSYWRHYNLLQESAPAFLELKRLIQIFYFRYIVTRDRSLNDRLPIWIQCWGNIDNIIREDETPHFHNLEDRNIVGVYYISGDFSPNNGTLFFTAQGRPESRLYVSPEAGTLLFFSPRLLHGKALYHGESPRISIAFDIRIDGDKQKKFINLFTGSPE